MAPRYDSTSSNGSLAQCIWAQSGVVRHHLCRRDFQCSTCRYDRAMTEAVAQPRTDRQRRLVHWKTRLRRLPMRQRPCLHAMKGQIPFRSCHQDYHCARCDFDQFFSDRCTVTATIAPVAMLDAAGFAFPQGYYLHPGHAWVRLEEGGQVCVGLDDFAVRLLGTVDAVDMPLMGKPLVRGGALAVLRRGALAVTVQSPVSGVVLDSQSDPQRLLSEPYGSGWLARVHPESLGDDLRGLMLGGESVAHVNRDADRLMHRLEAVLPMAADGGHFVPDILGHLPMDQWETVVSGFFDPQESRRTGRRKRIR